MKVPDGFDVLFRQAEAKYWFGKSEARGTLKEFAKNEGIAIDEDELVGSYSGKTGEFYYRWRIDPLDNSDDYNVVVEEDILISRRRFYLLLLPPLLISLLLVDFALTLSASTPLLILTTIVAFSIYGRSTLSVLEIPSLLDETQEHNEEYEMGTSIPLFNLLAVSVLLVGVIGVTYQNRSLAALPVPVAVALVYMAFRRVELNGTPLKIRKGVPFSFPALLTSYLIITAFFSLVPISVLVLYFSRVQERWPTLSVAIGFVTALYVWYIVRTVLTGNPAIESFEGFIEEQNERDHPEINKVNIALGILPSVVLVYGYIAVIYILDLNFTIQEPNDALAVLIGFTPGIYLLTGALLQTTSFVGKIHSLFRDSTTIETDGIQSEYNIRRLDSTGYDAYSLSTFSNHYIFISDKLFEDFEDSEIQSIIYHEESHIKNGDAFLSFILPIICLLTASPQGVLFESLDFRSREIRADREASLRSNANLKQTLTKLRRQQLTQPTQEEGTEPTFSPFSGKVSESKPNQYRLFFGAYAIKEAHPNLPDRIERL